MKRIIGVVLALILISMPFTSSVMTIEEEQPEYYEVTRYNMRGLMYDKETIQVSYEDAMAIKDAFEGIDSSFGDDKIERKANVLKSYGLIPRSIKSIQNSGMNHEYYRNETSLVFANIEGTFGPSIINIINFFVFAPYFATIAFGINVKHDTPLFPGWTFEFISNRPTSLAMMVFIGILIVFPLISPGGYINGVTFVGNIRELI